MVESITFKTKREGLLIFGGNANLYKLSRKVDCYIDEDSDIVGIPFPFSAPKRMLLNMYYAIPPKCLGPDIHKIRRCSKTKYVIVRKKPINGNGTEYLIYPSNRYGKILSYERMHIATEPGALGLDCALAAYLEGLSK